MMRGVSLRVLELRGVAAKVHELRGELTHRCVCARSGRLRVVGVARCLGESEADAWCLGTSEGASWDVKEGNTARVQLELSVQAVHRRPAGTAERLLRPFGSALSMQLSSQ